MDGWRDSDNCSSGSFICFVNQPVSCCCFCVTDLSSSSSPHPSPSLLPSLPSLFPSPPLRLPFLIWSSCIAGVPAITGWCRCCERPWKTSRLEGGDDTPPDHRWRIPDYILFFFFFLPGLVLRDIEDGESPPQPRCLCTTFALSSSVSVTALLLLRSRNDVTLHLDLSPRHSPMKNTAPPPPPSQAPRRVGDGARVELRSFWAPTQIHNSVSGCT